MSDGPSLFTPRVLDAIERRFAVVPAFARPTLWEHATRPQHAVLRAWLERELDRLPEPVRATFVSRLKPGAVVSLMCEPWEVRPQDVDVAACRAAGIPVLGTNERDPGVQTFRFVGMLALKLLLELEIEVLSSRIVVVSGGGSAATCSAWSPRNPAVPASVSPPTNFRRLQSLRRSLMKTSSNLATSTVVAHRLHDLSQCA